MIRRAQIVAAVILYLSFAPLVTAWQSASKSPSKQASQTVTIGDEDNGKDVDLTSGGTLVVKLKSNRSTGYSWAVAGDPSPLKLEKTSYRRNTASSQAVGAPGVQVFQFTANSAGMAALTLNYRRSWEYNLPPARTFRVRVDVR
jgi:inhibitor of cysteine peptidase